MLIKILLRELIEKHGAQSIEEVLSILADDPHNDCPEEREYCDYDDCKLHQAFKDYLESR